MTYLYGDSTDSGLELNYIELLREFLDFAVQLMLSEHRISCAQADADKSRRAAEAELERLRELGSSIASTLDQAKSPNAKSRTDQSIVSLQQTTEDTLRRAAEALKAQVTQDEQQTVHSRKRERATNAKLVERLLLHHQLPDSESTVDLALDADGVSYRAEVKGSCKQGLSWRFLADIPESHPYRHVCKVSSRQSELTIELPEMSGFVRKSVKLKPYRISPLFVVALEHKGADIHMKLRSSTQPDDDTGIDVRVTRKSGQVSIVRIQKGSESPPFTAADDDAVALASLSKELSDDCAGLVQERSKLLDVRFDQQALGDCPDPTELVCRLIERMGPVVQKISEHSLADSELVLKRVLANDRREEIFASKAELLDKLRAVPPQQRGIFSPLCLGDLGTEVGDYDPTNELSARSAEMLSNGLSPVVNDGADEDETTSVVDDTRDIDLDDIEVDGRPDTAQVITIAADEPPEHASAANPAPRRSRPSAPPSPPPARSAPALDSVDVALAELEAES